MLLALAQVASAQSCSCSIGTTDASLPTGRSVRAGGGGVGLDYGAGQTGGDGWEGVRPADDRLGNSMSDMAMPGHVVQSVRVSGTYGVSDGFAISGTLPLVYSVPLGVSDMPGDVAHGFPGDVGLTARWASQARWHFVGVGVGATLPTGPVDRSLGMRGGRGVTGVLVDVSGLRMVAPVLGFGGRAAWAQGLHTPKDGYLVGPQLDLAAGLRLWSREQGRVSLTALGAYLHRGRDRTVGVPLANTGVDCLLAGGGTDLRVWAHQRKTLNVSVRGQLPLVQVVGDPWLSENWSMSGGVSLGL